MTIRNFITLTIGTISGLVLLGASFLPYKINATNVWVAHYQYLRIAWPIYVVGILAGIVATILDATNETRQ